MTLTEAHLILPVRDNEGVILQDETNAISDKILNMFGGYSAMDMRGAWRDDWTGKVYHDISTLYVIAGDWKHLDDLELLLKLAQEACTLMRQESVYLCVNGEVVFVRPYDVLATRTLALTLAA